MTAILDEHVFRRPDLANVGIENETNRFLNYIRLTHVIGDKAWQTAPPLSERRSNKRFQRSTAKFRVARIADRCEAASCCDYPMIWIPIPITCGVLVLSAMTRVVLLLPLAMVELFGWKAKPPALTVLPP